MAGAATPNSLASRRMVSPSRSSRSMISMAVSMMRSRVRGARILSDAVDTASEPRASIASSDTKHGPGDTVVWHGPETKIHYQKCLQVGPISLASACHVGCDHAVHESRIEQFGGAVVSRSVMKCLDQTLAHRVAATQDVRWNWPDLVRHLLQRLAVEAVEGNGILAQYLASVLFRYIGEGGPDPIQSIRPRSLWMWVVGAEEEPVSPDPLPKIELVGSR